ncbi:hypothetical protein C8Q74DRAFT_1303621 [Fomes fomentarius]|nr:hypothetical protein C8Q74DRAFT_1303594 [Fomes fomentarius]KAI0758177.1 hypothetical protein C8Q74DRAFT_1303608 [Fomes fomentarius]KAI0758180.1 hypothetical protein C8Q74DRAFT_1303621 [Fomes fomentarius]
MGQDWELLCIDRKEKSPEVGGKLGEFFFDSFSSLLEALRLPILPSEVETWLKRGDCALQPGSLGKLSPEVLDIIFWNVSSVQDAVRFAITCKLLLDVGQPHLLRLLQGCHAPWANARLICLGRDTDRNADLPPDLLTKDELHQVVTCVHPHVLDCLEPGQEPHFALVACETYKNKYGTTSYHARTEYYDELSRLHEEAAANPKLALEVKMYKELCIFSVTGPAYPPGALVLCNLSKAEYVREDRLSKMVRKIHGWVEEFGLMHALLSRICWSVDPSISMCCDKKYKERLTKGPWAGDRFCVVTLETMPRPNVAKEWKDVTAEVDKLLAHLWKVNTEK